MVWHCSGSEGLWVSITPLCLLCLTSPGLASTILPIKSCAGKAKQGKSPVWLWQRRWSGPGKGSNSRQPKEQLGVQHGAPRLRLRKLSFPQAFMFSGGPSGSQREDEEAITAPLPNNRWRGTLGPLPPNSNRTAACEGTAEISAGSRLGLVHAAPLWVAPPGALRPGRGAPHGQ